MKKTGNFQSGFKSGFFSSFHGFLTLYHSGAKDVQAMSQKLSINELSAILDRLRQICPSRQCWSCECLQGFLTRLEMDAEDDASALISSLEQPLSDTQSCLECDPCPPAALFAEYIRKSIQNTPLEL